MEGVLPSNSFGCQIRGTESAEKRSVYQTLLFFSTLLFFFHYYSLFKGSIFMAFASILR